MIPETSVSSVWHKGLRSLKSLGPQPPGSGKLAGEGSLVPPLLEMHAPLVAASIHL